MQSIERALKIILVALATYRATYMVLAEDGPFDSLQRWRDFIYSNFEENHWIYRGFNCSFCLSFWFALLFWLMPEWMVSWFSAAEVARRLFERD